jgi:hypothetical protein
LCLITRVVATRIIIGSDQASRLAQTC